MRSRQTSERADPEREATLEAPARGQAGTVERLLGLQRSIGNRRTAALVGGMQPRSISRYKILGPFNKGQAVHETLTLLAVKKAKERLEAAKEAPGDLLKDFNAKTVPDTNAKFGYDPVNADASHAQFIRGVVFGFAKATDVQARQRAVGALFHMIQDSFAHGHVDRDAAGDIAEFHAYGGQDEHKHGEYDFLGGSDSDKLGDRVAKTMGAPSAIDRCADVLTLIAEDKSTDEIVKFLDETVFKLASSTKAAGPGAGLTKPPPRPVKEPDTRRPHPGKI